MRVAAAALKFHKQWGIARRAKAFQHEGAKCARLENYLAL
jgi:hypothetical protein